MRQTPKRFQRGSVIRRQHGNHENWLGYWYENGQRRCKVLGRCSRMTESEAHAALAAILAPINAGLKPGPVWTFGEYVKKVFLPLQARYWKDSTAMTSDQAIRRHLLPEFGDRLLRSMDRAELQAFLDRKSTEHAASTVKHLRWYLNGIFRLAMADGAIDKNPAEVLRVADRLCKKGWTVQALTADQVVQLLAVLPTRERLICRLGIFEGLRVGEIFALQWRDVQGRRLTVARRIYQGRVNTPKSGKPRQSALSEGSAALIEQWRAACEFTDQEDFLFASLNRRSPLRPENVWKNFVRSHLVALGLEWLTYHQLRHTNGTLMQAAGADAKVSADQRGHQIGVSLSVYTHSSLESKAGAVDLLEKSIDQAAERSAKRAKTA